MAIDANEFDVRRWHSMEYVADWIANREQEEGRKVLREKLISLLSFEPETELRVLDWEPVVVHSVWES